MFLSPNSGHFRCLRSRVKFKRRLHSPHSLAFTARRCQIRVMTTHIKLVSIRAEDSESFVRSKRTSWPNDLDLRGEQKANLAITHALFNLTVTIPSQSIIHVPFSSSIFCERCSDDTIGRPLHLFLDSSPANQPEKVVFQTADESLQLIERFDAVAKEYRAQGAALPPVQTLIFDYLRLVAREKLNTLIFSDMRIMDYE